MATTETTAFEKKMPEAIDGMVTITRNAFFASVGRLNVHPGVVGRYDRTFGFRSDWKTPDGEVIAVTVGGTVFAHTRYMVTQRIFNGHRAAIAAAG